MNLDDSIIVLDDDDDDDEDEVTVDKTNKNLAKITKTSGFRFPSEVEGYTRPSYSFSQLVTQALATCRNRTATALEICELIAQKQPYYKYYPGDWQKHIYSALTKRNKFFVIVGKNPNNEFIWSFNPTFEKYMLNKWVPKYLKTKSGVNNPSNADPVLSTPSSESTGNCTVRGPVIVSARSLRAEETREMQAEFDLENLKQVPESNIGTGTSNTANPWEPEVTVSEPGPPTDTSNKTKEQKITVANFESLHITSEEVIYRLSFHKEHTKIQKFRLHCTVCDCHLGSAGSHLKNSMGVHPQLGVLICRLCSTGSFQGQADVCTWCCKLDGVFFLCSNCPSKFCEACIKRNFGGTWCSKLAGRRDWKCFLCFTKQIWPHRAIAYFLFRHFKKIMRKKTELEKAVLNKDPLYPKIADLQFFETDLSECCKQKSHKEGPSELASDVLSTNPPESVYAIPLPLLQPEPSSHNIFVNHVPWVTVNTGTQYIQNMYSGPESCLAAPARPRVSANTSFPQTFTNSMLSTSGLTDNPILSGMLKSRYMGHVFSGENQGKPNFPSDKNFTSALRCHTSDPTGCPKTSVEMPVRLHNSTSSLYAPPTTIPRHESVQLSTSQDLQSAKQNSDLPYSYYNLSSTNSDKAMKSSPHISRTSHVTGNTAIQSRSYDSILNSETNDDPEVKVVFDGGCLINKSHDSFNTGIPSQSTNTVVSTGVPITNVGIRPQSFLINEGNSNKTAVTEEATERSFEEVKPAPAVSLRERINSRPMPKSKKQTLLRTVLMNESIESMKRHLQHLQPTISGTDSGNSESISSEARIKSNSNTTVLSNPQAAKTSETDKRLEEPILHSIIETATKALSLLDFKNKLNSALSTSVAKTTDSLELNDICEPHQPTSAPLSEIPKIKIRTLKELQDPSRLTETRQNDSKEVNKVKVNIINPEPGGICINFEVPEKEINVTSLKRGIIESSRTLIHTQKKFKELAKVISCNLSYKPDQAVELVNKFQEILKTCRKQMDVIDTNITKEFGSLLPACNSNSVLTSNNNNNTPSNSCDENHSDQPTKVKQKIKKRKKSKVDQCYKPLLVPNVNEEPSQSNGWEYMEKSGNLQSLSTRKRKPDFLNFQQDHKRIFLSTSNEPEKEKLSSEFSPLSDCDYDPTEDLKQQWLLKRQTLCKKYKRKRNIWACKRKYRPSKKVGDVDYNLDGSIRKRRGRPPNSLKQNQLHQKPKPVIFKERRLSGRQHPSSAALGIDPTVITCYLPPRCEIRPCSVVLHKLNQRFVQLLTRTIRP